MSDIERHIFKSNEVYWTEDFETFDRLAKKKNVSFSRHTLYIPYKSLVLVYGSLEPTNYPVLRRLSDGRKAFNCHTKQLEPILDCPPDTNFYLGYIKRYKNVKSLDDFYVFQGFDNCEVDQPLEFSDSMYGLVGEVKYFDKESDFVDDFELLDQDSLSLSIVVKTPETKYMIYYIHLDDEGKSVPAWSYVTDTVMLVYKQTKNEKNMWEWKKIEANIYDWSKDKIDPA